jgi:hypothetical protein
MQGFSCVTPLRTSGMPVHAEGGTHEIEFARGQLIPLPFLHLVRLLLPPRCTFQVSSAARDRQAPLGWHSALAEGTFVPRWAPNRKEKCGWWR